MVQTSERLGNYAIREDANLLLMREDVSKALRKTSRKLTFEEIIKVLHDGIKQPTYIIKSSHPSYVKLLTSIQEIRQNAATNIIADQLYLSFNPIPDEDPYPWLSLPLSGSDKRIIGEFGPEKEDILYRSLKPYVRKVA